MTDTVTRRARTRTGQGHATAAKDMPARVASRPIRIVIADNSHIVRAGVRNLVTGDPRFFVGDTVGSGEMLMHALDEQPYDIAIIGWTFPGMSGGDVLATLKRRRFETRAIVYTGQTGPLVLRQAVLLGAWAFVSKSEDPAELLAAISAVSKGRLSFPYSAAQCMGRSPLDDITVREFELLSLLADGLSNAEIAVRWRISRNTVKYHLKNLYGKLGVNSRTTAVALLLSNKGRNAVDDDEPHPAGAKVDDQRQTTDPLSRAGHCAR